MPSDSFIRPCTKIGFYSRKEAQGQVNSIRSCGGRESRLKGGKKISIYKCPYCQLFHMTSMTKKQRKINARSRKRSIIKFKKENRI